MYVAEQSKRYFRASEVPEMLETFLPLLTQDVCRVGFYNTPMLKLPFDTDRSDNSAYLDVIPSPNPYTSLSPSSFQTLGGVQLFCHGR